MLGQKSKKSIIDNQFFIDETFIEINYYTYFVFLRKFHSFQTTVHERASFFSKLIFFVEKFLLIILIRLVFKIWIRFG